jgi:uncharacterized membrane protein YgcG
VIRHSQSYLFGAISGTAVIAAAVVFFVLFVSAQALRDWPIGDLSIGGGNDSAAVSPAQSLGGAVAPNPAAAKLSGPITGTPANVAPATKATGAAKQKSSGKAHHGTGKVAPETRIEGGRGIDSAPVQQPSSTAPTPAPTSGSGPSPAGSGTASPAPSSGGGGSAPSSGGGSEGGGGSSQGGSVGTKTARRVTNTVNEISSAAPPPAPSPVTNTVNEVVERAEQTPPPAGDTSDRVKEAIAGIGN